MNFHLPPEGQILPAIRAIDHLDIDISMFKRIHVDRSSTQIESIEEARSIYENDRQDLQALEYIAWWLLCADSCNDEAGELLEKAVAIGRDSLFVVKCKLDNKSQIMRTLCPFLRALGPGSFWVIITSQRHNLRKAMELSNKLYTGVVFDPMCGC